MQIFFQNHNSISDALRLRITSDECKDDIPQWGSIREHIHNITQRFFHERKRIYVMPSEEIHLWIEASL
jgi:hypothetical protein